MNEMNEDIRNKIVDRLLNMGVIRTWSENKVITDGDANANYYSVTEINAVDIKNVSLKSDPTKIIPIDNAVFFEGNNMEKTYSIEDMGLSTDKKFYIKEKVMGYLQEKGYQINQTNIDLAAGMFYSDDLKISLVSNVYRETTEHNELENSTAEEVSAFMEVRLLEAVTNLEKQLKKPVRMEYRVETVTDNRSGGTDLRTLSSVLNNCARDGWILKMAFTNELGVNSSTIGYGGVSVGTNATIDQIVLIFERAVQ